MVVQVVFNIAREQGNLKLLSDLSRRKMYQQPKENLEKLSGRRAILEILSRAADDHKFLAQLAENPYRVLGEYNLTPAERIALARGDIAKIESWVGQLDKRLRTWFKVRLTRERW